VQVSSRSEIAKESRASDPTGCSFRIGQGVKDLDIFGSENKIWIEEER
jgi:hypothetical protein